MRRWTDAPIVFVVRPACPHCGGAEYMKIRTDSGGDGSVMRRVICRACSQPWKLVIENPESGNPGKRAR